MNLDFDEPIRILCLYRWGSAYKLGGLGKPMPGQDWKPVAQFEVDPSADITEDGWLTVMRGTQRHRIRPEGVALIGPDGWFGIKPLDAAKPKKRAGR